MKRVIACLLLSAASAPLAQAQDMEAFRRNMVNAANALGQGHITEPPTSPATQDNGGVALTQKLTYSRMSNTLGQASILGLSLGMSAPEATTVLRQYCQTEPSLRTETLRTSHKGVDIESQPYPGSLACQRESDRIDVTLAPPVMGGVVTRIERTASYPPLNAPGYDTLKAELTAHYTAHLPPLSGGSAATALYALKSGNVIEKADGTGIDPSPSSDPRAATTQAWLRIDVSVVPQNPSAVRSLSITTEDIGAEQAITAEIIRQLNAAIDAKLAHATAKPAL